MLISMASIGESWKIRVTSAYSSIVDPHTLAINRVSEKSSPGRYSSTTLRAPGFCSPMEFSMPMYVSAIRCAGLPRRGSSVVPLRQTAPASRLEKPLTLVYSSPNPTQPDSSTSGVSKRIPQKSIESPLPVLDIYLNLWGQSKITTDPAINPDGSDFTLTPAIIIVYNHASAVFIACILTRVSKKSRRFQLHFHVERR